MTLNESIVEDAALEWFGDFGLTDDEVAFYDALPSRLLLAGPGHARRTW